MAPFLRLAEGADEPFLWAMLSEASYAAEDGIGSPDDLRAIPALARYVEGWSQRPGDLGVVGGMEAEGPLVGAAWARLMTRDQPGYGYVDDDTPELAIAVEPSARGVGLGTALLARLLAEARRHVGGVSLSVRSDNPARRLYTKVGFVAVDDPGGGAPESTSGTSVTMLLRFTPPA